MISSIRSVRILRKHWKLSAIGVFSLSIAMGLGVMSLSVSNTMLFLPPAAPAADRLVVIQGRSAEAAIEQISYPDYRYYRENNHVFTDVAAAPNSISLNGDSNFAGREIKVLSRPVSENYFAVMEIRPFLGRLFAVGDDESRTPIAVMTYACWERLGSDPNIVGKVLVKRTIVGVTPKDFTGSFYGLNGDLLIPLSESEYTATWRTQRDARRLFLLARLKPGVSRRKAQAEMATLSGQLASAYPKEDKGRSVVIARATLLPPDAVATAEMVAAILMALVLLVLLIGCANVANLLLAVAVGRRQEAAIKLALGASRRRLMQEFMKEGAIICAASGALGYGIASAVISRYSVLRVDLATLGEFSLSLDLHLDATVIVFTIALMLIAIVATGLAPALYASSPNLAQVMGGEVVVGGTRKGIRRNALVIVQVGICTLVLVGMGLCQRNLYNLRHVDPGFPARNLVAVQVYPKSEGSSEAQGKERYGRLRTAVSALPGVESVSLASDLPLLGESAVPVQFPDLGKQVRISHAVVDADYVATFGIPVLNGRAFNSGDREGSQEVVVINRKMAEMFWRGMNPVGKAVMLGDPARKAIVVGVVANGKYLDLNEPERPFIYSALSQHYQAGFNIVASTKGDPHLWVEPLAQTMRAFGLTVVAQPITFDAWMNLTLLPERITAGFVGTLSALGLLLAIVGLFGAISYSVSERRKELGIRIALGARPWQLLGMVLRQTLLVAGSGVAIGILLGVGATALFRSRFFGIAAVEWSVLVPVGAAMLTVSLLVAYLSARPWVTIDPMEAVRHA